MTTVNLSPELETWVREKVEAGRAPTAEAFIENTLREARAVEDEHRRLVRTAAEAVERGDVIEEDEAEAIWAQLLDLSH